MSLIYELSPLDAGLAARYASCFAIVSAACVVSITTFNDESTTVEGETSDAREWRITVAYFWFSIFYVAMASICIPALGFGNALFLAADGRAGNAFVFLGIEFIAFCIGTVAGIIIRTERKKENPTVTR